MSPIAIDPALVARRIAELAAFGAIGETGVSRTVYSQPWAAAADHFAGWCEAAGLATRRDAVGNIWARLEGSEGGKAIVSGSHLDSQVSGGQYDGSLGAIGALIAIATLRERFGTPRRPLEVVVFCEEEGSRFPTANFWGSRAITGQIADGEADRVREISGPGTIADAMRAIDLDPGAIASARRDDIGAFIELHIEQGPILEHAGLPVAVVDAITGSRQYRVSLSGTQNHAGAFPMDLRIDPMVGFAEIVTTLTDDARRLGRPAVTTFGRVEVIPNATAIIPERVTFSLDVRHPDGPSGQALYASHEARMREIAARHGLGLDWTIMSEHLPCPSDAGIVAALQAAARDAGISTLTMASGAMHDSQQMAAICPMAMVFIRSKDGRSHTPDEFSSLDDMVAGITVLADALHRLAY